MGTKYYRLKKLKEDEIKTIKRLGIQSKEKPNWMTALKNWKGKHRNRGGEKKKEKKRKGCQCQTKSLIFTRAI